jgi:pyruvate formate lyase activating enzyme
MITRRDMLLSSAALAGMCAVPACFAKPSEITRKTALYWHSVGDRVTCELCPRACSLAEGRTGSCRTRSNVGGALVTDAYANPCSIDVDPIEALPLCHALPGAKTYSLAIAGCNLRCLNCKSFAASQVTPRETKTTYLPPEKAVEAAKKAGCTAIAYTNTEPVAWYEYMLDTAKLARKAGLKNILVTAGYINKEPLKELAAVMDAASISLKSFSETTYERLNSARLAPVLDAITAAIEYGMWVEVSTLIVPSWTDDFGMIRAQCAWHKKTLGPDVPLHFVRFFPLYKLDRLSLTPIDTLRKAQTIAREEGLRYVYLGNAPEADANTYCPSCKKAVITRKGVVVKKNALKNGSCPFCGTGIKGLWV